MEEYIDWTGQAGSQEAAEEIAAAPPVQHYNANPSSYAQDRTNGSYLNPNFPSNLSCDIKPRLTKEQHDILENHYQKQNKPNTNTKKSFAESLNVSLDKVNNWFQNRRAKSKQDAKKHAGLTNIFQGHRRAASESDSSPGFVNPSSTYHTHMQQWTMEQGGHHGLGIASVQEQQRLQMYGLQNGISQPEPLQSYLAPAQFGQDVHDELNRRTLTQDQFSAIEQNGGILDAFGNFEDLGTSFFGDQGVMNTVFPPHTGDIKQQEAYIYPVGPVGPPLSSYDSTVPSNVSEQSLPVFPSNPNMQTHANAPSPSDWADSRSATTNDSAVPQSPPQPQTTTTTTTTTAQWTPGQSVPVDPTAQYEAFQQAAAMAHERASPQLSIYEQPSPWADEAYLRRASTTSLLAHSMSAVGIHTPPQYQGATFKSPAPPSNIAARRQRARPPAQLSMTNLRSQSHSGVAQPGGSPLEMPQPPFAMGDQPLRRIRSSNYLGSVAHGRVQKSTPNSANRSPMHYTFADAANSSQAVRHGSQGSLAPPTPMSPKDSSGLEQAGYIHQFQVGPGNSSRQASMHENDAEHTTHAPVVVPAPNRTSPPHTPANYQQQFVLARVHSNGVMENTPPQSAPAGQTCFPSNVYAMPYMPQQSMQQYPVQPQAPVPQHMHAIAMSQPQPQRFVNPVAPDQQFQMSNVVFAPNQHVNIPTTGPPPGAPIQFSQGVPMTNADGNIELVFPPQLHFVHQHQGQSQTPPQHMHTPPQISYPFGPTAGGSPGAQASTFQQKPAHDFFVHEWAPPESVRRSATPRKGPVDTAPKNYAFANTGPEHFDAKKSDEKKKRLDSKDGGPSSSSPASSDGTALTA